IVHPHPVLNLDDRTGTARLHVDIPAQKIRRRKKTKIHRSIEPNRPLANELHRLADNRFPLHPFTIRKKPKLRDPDSLVQGKDAALDPCHLCAVVAASFRRAYAASFATESKLSGRTSCCSTFTPKRVCRNSTNSTTPRESMMPSRNSDASSA